MNDNLDNLARRISSLSYLEMVDLSEQLHDRIYDLMSGGGFDRDSLANAIAQWAKDHINQEEEE